MDVSNPRFIYVRLADGFLMMRGVILWLFRIKKEIWRRRERFDGFWHSRWELQVVF